MDITELSDVDYKIFSQNGEDGIIDYILYSLKIKNQNSLKLVLATILSLIQGFFLRPGH